MSTNLNDMGKKVDKRFILTDDSINSYGFRVLTSGINLDRFRKNPILLWMHLRDEGSPEWCDYKPIGHWEDIVYDEKAGTLSAVPYFDLTDDLSKQICAKVEEGTINATSIGFRIIETSEDKQYLLPGQTRATVTKSEIMECSLVDIPANANAVRLYDSKGKVNLSISDALLDTIPLLKNNTPMKLKATWLAILAFLGIAKEKAEETELSAEQLESINGEMASLKDQLAAKETEITNLKTQHQSELSNRDSQIQTLTTEKTNLESQVKTLTTEKTNLESQVTALKGAPAGGNAISPKNDPDHTELSDIESLEKQLEEGKLTYSQFAEQAKKLGF